jgi:Cu+-exporting ATPase
MSCEHCVAHVTRALKEVPGVIDAKVNLDKGQAEVSYDASKASQTDLEKAVVAVGYGIARHDLPENSPGGEGGYE